MDFKDIQELVKLINKSNLSEFIMQDGEFKLTIRTKNYVKGKLRAMEPQVVSVAQPQVIPVHHMQPVQPTPAAPQETGPKAATSEPAENDDTANYLEVKSPIVGTFYRSPSPDKPVYVKVGDTIAAGDVVCIVEAMKLFNEIETEISGKIVKVMIEDASPVEYDQVLYLVDPKG
ncbi:MAG: acetyl-CoA carboxylase biotin carboxyl carrier protein [Maribacter sp.]|jgi:acetyl-CoA carboxylase biotin carboxyl carrier protein